MEEAQERENAAAQAAVLMEPTAGSPWWIQITAALPDALPLSNAVTVVRAGSWMCLVSKADDKQGGYQLHVWHDHSSSHTFRAQKFQTPILKLTNPKFTDSPEPPLVAMHLTQGQETTTQSSMEAGGAGAMMQQQHHSVGSHNGKEAVFLYVALPTGSVYLWKLSLSDLHLPIPPSHKSFMLLELEDGYNDADMNQDESLPAVGDERLSCLTVQRRTLFLATNWGRVFWLHQNQGNLKVQQVLRNSTLAMAAKDSSSGGGWSISRLLFGKGSDSFEGRNAPPETAEEAVGVNQVSGNDEKTFAPLSALSLTEAIQQMLVQQKVNSHVTDLHVLKASNGTFPPTLLKAAGTRCVHLVVLLTFVPAQSNEPHNVEQRLYWLRVACSSAKNQQVDDFEICSMTWLSRFASPETVRVMGLYVAENGVGYTALIRGDREVAEDSPVSSIPILMAHDAFKPHAFEVDLDSVGETSVLGLFGDDRTHGCTFCTSSGTLILSECKEATDNSLRGEHDDIQQHGQHREDPLKVTSLLSHLRATFWESYRHPEKLIVLPPSLECADKSDLEAAIWKMGEELQMQNSNNANFGGITSSSNLVLVYHLAYIEFLQSAGIYRSMMPLTKWHLMALGQEIAAFQAIVASPRSNENMEIYRSQLNSFGVANWLQSVQRAVESQEADMKHVFCCWLEQALSAAHIFRQERGTLLYDIASSADPPKVDKAKLIPLWMSKPTIQSVLFTQLQNWHKDSDKSLRMMSNEVESIVVASLRSFADSYLAFRCGTTQDYYYKMQCLTIKLLRDTFGTDRDDLAWSLCKAHHYFSGLCQIAHDHRHSQGRGPRAANHFSLTTLFPKLAQTKDLKTEMPFGQFCIKWHLDRTFIGEALQYGNLCPDDLLVIVNAEPALRPYRWIVSLQRKNHEAATRNLLEVVDRADTGLSLQQSKFNLSMAKLSNKVAASKSVSNPEQIVERGKRIENMREIAQVQELLLCDEDAQNTYLWTVESLLEYALQKVDREDGIDAKARTCFLALCLCCSLESGGVDARKQAACSVWYKALVADWDFLTDLLYGKQQSLTDEGLANAVLQKSVFGKLMEECSSNPKSSWGEVSFDNIVERFVIDKISSPNDRSSMQRLLRAVLTKV
eukprot:CAMPEP_0168739852 /NCGR_PEP_ID=MMETSP0724-20121128/11675_1 /TAXON_ID=265536 /ORGANISM="Amphiprora sp., Strain CCMP467" /LENGTH=1128 /DNA_ID=CAMNT_0008787265 /DNA_START=1 /DNA_END=3388 /DNA_ORIENTATION=-